MTVKEMGPVRRAPSPALFMFVRNKLRGKKGGSREPPRGRDPAGGQC
jgi:hypothetical protein